MHTHTHHVYTSADANAKANFGEHWDFGTFQSLTSWKRGENTARCMDKESSRDLGEIRLSTKT